MVESSVIGLTPLTKFFSGGWLEPASADERDRQRAQPADRADRDERDGTGEVERGENKSDEEEQTWRLPGHESCA